MKKETDKWIFVLVLVVLLVVVCLVNKTDKKVDEYNNNISDDIGLDNHTLGIEVREDIIYIDGQGKLEYDDLKRLVAYENLESDDVVNLVIGNGITELGYNCLIGWEKLETIKIGSGVTVLNNGSIRSCPNLKFLFIPESVEKIGKDFLAYSKNIVIVSDGYLLNSMIRTDDNYLYEGIKSYEALKDNIKNSPIIYQLDEETVISIDNPEQITDALSVWW